MNRHLAPAGSFGPQTQTFFAVEPVNDVFADLPAFPLEQDMHPPVSEPDPRRCNLMHPLAELSPRIAD
jgi:hypothetical protein